MRLLAFTASIVALSQAALADTATDTAFSGQCLGMFQNAAKCRCMAVAAIEQLPNENERSIYYSTLLRRDTFNQIRALADMNGYVARSNAATNAMMTRPCPGAG